MMCLRLVFVGSLILLGFLEGRGMGLFVLRKLCYVLYYAMDEEKKKREETETQCF